MSLSKRKIKSSLESKGFVEKPDGRHIRLVFQRENRMGKIVTYVSHGSGKTISNKLASYMAKQCRIKMSQFRDLVDCKMSEDDYINVLASSGQQQKD